MKTNLNYDQYIPTRILFGAGQLNNLHAQPMPGKRALIVISNGKSTRDNGYLARAEKARAEQKRLENTELSPSINYMTIDGLRLEAREKLNKVKPLSIGQAGRISGVTPADINVLILSLAKRK